MFGGLFGDAIFGDAVFADLNAVGTRPHRGAVGIGGSGFPDNWFEVMSRNTAENERQRRRLERDLEEIAMLTAAGLL